MAPGPNGICYRDADWGIYVADSTGANPVRLADGQFVPGHGRPTASTSSLPTAHSSHSSTSLSPTIRLLGPAGSGGAFRP